MMKFSTILTPARGQSRRDPTIIGDQIRE
jgi:hypothetical protein